RQGHGRALDVPAGASRPPGTVPRRFAGLGGLPEGEIHGIALALVGFKAGPGHELLEPLAAEFPVVRKPGYVEENVPVHRVRKALLLEDADHLHDLADVLADPGIVIRLLNAEPPHGVEILLRVTGGQRQRILAPLPGPLNDL